MTATWTAEEFAERLRGATRPAHRILDQHPLLLPLIRAPLSHADYGRALAALHGPQCALEARLGGFAPAADFPPRRADLESDLATLGVTAQPLLADLPEFDSPTSLLGAFYVIEGSNLGGAVIARMLAKNLISPSTDAFFGKAGGNARWARYQAFARPHYREDNFQVIADAANRTFRWYAQHLDRCRLA